jgi:N-methylhydantoinase B
VAACLCSTKRARDLYGVVLDAAGQVDAAATAARRDALRAERLREGRPAAALFGSGNGRSYLPTGEDQTDGERSSHQYAPGGRGNEELLASVADAFVVIEREGAPWYACAACGHSHGPADADPKRGLLVRERSIAELSDWNRFGLVDEIVVREYYCPGCALLASAEVRRRGEPPLEDTRLALAVPALVGAID